METPPQKPARPHEFLGTSALKVGPSLAVNLENVNSPNSSNVRSAVASPNLSAQDQEPNDNMSIRSQLYGHDNESRLSVTSMSRVPVLTINRSEADQQSIMENELDMLMNDDGGILGDSVMDGHNIDDFQINISDLMTKLSTLESGMNTIELHNSEIEDQVESDSDDKQQFLQHKKQCFVLSSAGKPIYSLFGSQSTIVNYMSIIQTLISSFHTADFNPFLSSPEDNLRCFKTRSTKFVILNKSPIYLLTISSYGFESVSELRNQLFIVYNYILSILSKKQLAKFYAAKSNFDLTSILNASDFSLLRKIIVSKSVNPVFFLNGIESFYLQHTVKLKINHIIEKTKSATPPNQMLYGILSDLNGKVVTIMKPRKHSLHTTDLQILFSIIFNKAARTRKEQKKIVVNKKIVQEVNNHIDFSNFDESEVDFSNEEELWFPICLPEFNPNGFLYCFVNYVDINNIDVVSGTDTIVSSPDINDSNRLVFIVLSPDKNAFFDVRKASKKIILEMILSQNSQIWQKLVKAFKFNYKLNYLNFLVEFNRKHPAMNIITTSSSINNNFFHFIFKSKKNSQVFFPSFNSVNVASVNSIQFEQLMLLYKELSSNLTQHYTHSSSSAPAAPTRSFTPLNGLGNTIGGIFSSGNNEAQLNNNNNRRPKETPVLNNEPPNSQSRSNLVYLRWNVNGVKMIGIAYSNANYELFVLLKESAVLKNAQKPLLVGNLKVIINWIFKNFERLFISGLTF